MSSGSAFRRALCLQRGEGLEGQAHVKGVRCLQCVKGDARGKFSLEK